jgi:hypothetical protein
MKYVILALVNFLSRNTSFALIVIPLEFKMHLFGHSDVPYSLEKWMKIYCISFFEKDLQLNSNMVILSNYITLEKNATRQQKELSSKLKYGLSKIILFYMSSS